MVFLTCDVSTVDLWRDVNKSYWHFDIIFVDCSCTCQFVQMRSSLVNNNHEYRYLTTQYSWLSVQEFRINNDHSKIYISSYLSLNMNVLCQGLRHLIWLQSCLYFSCGIKRTYYKGKYIFQHVLLHVKHCIFTSLGVYISLILIKAIQVHLYFPGIYMG